jgi:hypothetical protein
MWLNLFFLGGSLLQILLFLFGVRVMVIMFLILVIGFTAFDYIFVMVGLPLDFVKF